MRFVLLFSFALAWPGVTMANLSTLPEAAFAIEPPRAPVNRDITRAPEDAATALSAAAADSPTASAETGDANERESFEDDAPRIGAVAIQGNALPTDAFGTAIEPLIGSAATEENLARLVQQVAEIARERGMTFATASVPEQEVALGIVRVELDAGTIDEVRIEGSDNRYLRAILDRLVGKAASEAELERALLLADDIPDIWVRGSSIVEEGGRNILVVRVGESGDDIFLRADNYGTRTYGPLRMRAAYRSEAAFTDSDRLYLALRGTPLEPSELLYVSGEYDVGVGSDGLRAGVAASLGTTEAGGRFEARAIDGDALYLSTYASYPLLRRRDASVWLTGEAAYLDIDKTEDGATLREDSSTTLSLGLAGQFRVASGRLRARAELVRGIDLFGATRDGDPDASRSDGDAVFTKGVFRADWEGSLAGPLRLDLGLRGQIASRPLLAAQEMGIGGAYTVRGYDFSELSGDSGVAGLVELSWLFDEPAKWLDELAPYAFADGGYVDDLRRSGGGGELYSAGGGLRVDFGDVSLEAESAWPINRDREQSDDKSPHLNFRVNMSL